MAEQEDTTAPVLSGDDLYSQAERLLASRWNELGGLLALIVDRREDLDLPEGPITADDLWDAATDVLLTLAQTQPAALQIALSSSDRSPVP